MLADNVYLFVVVLCIIKSFMSVTVPTRRQLVHIKIVCQEYSYMPALLLYYHIEYQECGES